MKRIAILIAAFMVSLMCTFTSFAEEYTQDQLDALASDGGDSDWRTWASFPLYESDQLIGVDPLDGIGYEAYVSPEAVVMAAKYYNNDSRGLKAHETEDYDVPFAVNKYTQTTATMGKRLHSAVTSYAADFKRMIEIKTTLDANGGKLTEEARKEFSKGKYKDLYYVVDNSSPEGIARTNIPVQKLLDGAESGDAAEDAQGEIESGMEEMGEQLSGLMEMEKLDANRLKALSNMDPMANVTNIGIPNIAGMDIIKRETTSWYGLMKTIGIVGLVFSIMTAALKLAISPRKKGEVMETVGNKLIAAIMLFAAAGIFGMVVDVMQQIVR